VRTQLILVTLSALPFVILFVKVVLAGGTDGNSLLPFDPTHMAAGGSIFKGVLFAILMFAGFELSAALGEETKEPKRSIPLAVLLTIVMCAIFFIMTQYTLAIGTHQPGQGFAVLSRTYLPPVFAVWIDLALILDLIASAIGFQLACARGLYTFARDGVLPGSLARLNARQIPMAGNAVMTALSLAVVLLVLAVYGTGFVDAHAAGSFANARAFRGFLGLAVVSGLLFSFVYMLMCFGALRTFGRRSLIDAAASVAGIGTCLLAILAQFIEGTGPEPDYQWGRSLSAATILFVALWVAFLKKDTVERVAQHTIEHG
jgi:amino acid transporter